MKILVLNYEYPPLGGGAAPVCRDLAAGMAVAGHKVTVVTMGFHGLPEHEVKDGVEIYRLKCLRKNKSSCMPWEQMSYIFAAERFLGKYLKDHLFDVCHTHFIVPTGPVALWVKKHFGIPYIVTAHGSDVEGYNSKKWMRIMHFFLRPAWKKIVGNASAVVSPSKPLMRLMQRAKRNGKYVLIPNGLDTDKYQAEPGVKEHRILVMGRMQGFKNIQTVLKAVALIPDKVWEDWKMDILGDGPYRSELEKLCTQLGIEKRVQFHGWIDNGSPEQLDYLNKVSIYISASHFENCPMAVLEAVASGCYPLLSDIEGHRQFFRKTASDQYFFPMDNEKVLSEKLEEVFKKSFSSTYDCIDVAAYDERRIACKYLKLLERAVSLKNERYKELDG